MNPRPYLQKFLLQKGVFIGERLASVPVHSELLSVDVSEPSVVLLVQPGSGDMVEWRFWFLSVGDALPDKPVDFWGERFGVFVFREL